MDEAEAKAIKDLLKTVRIGLVIMAVCAGYLNKDSLVGLI